MVYSADWGLMGLDRLGRFTIFYKGDNFFDLVCYLTHQTPFEKLESMIAQ